MRDSEVEGDDFLEKTIEDADFYRRRSEKLSNLVPDTFQWHYRQFLDAASIKNKDVRREVEEDALKAMCKIEIKSKHKRSFKNLHLLAFAVESRSHDCTLLRARVYMWLIVNRMFSLRSSKEESMICLSLAGSMLPLKRFDDICDQLFSELFVGCEKCQDLVGLYPYCPKASQKLTIRNAIGRRATFGELEEMFMTQQYKFLNFSADTIFHWMEKVGTEIEMEDFWNRALSAGSKTAKTFLKERKEKPPEREEIPKKKIEGRILFCQENRCPGQRLGMPQAKKDN